LESYEIPEQEIEPIFLIKVEAENLNFERLASGTVQFLDLRHFQILEGLGFHVTLT
jgi:hypothetical protein